MRGYIVSTICKRKVGCQMHGRFEAYQEGIYFNDGHLICSYQLVGQEEEGLPGGAIEARNEHQSRQYV
jgi:hypothetical protein